MSKKFRFIAAMLALVVVAAVISLTVYQNTVNTVSTAPSGTANVPSSSKDSMAAPDPDRKPQQGDGSSYPAPVVKVAANGIVSSSDVKHDTMTKPLRDIAPLPAFRDDSENAENEAMERAVGTDMADQVDTVVQRDFIGDAMPTPIVNFEGINVAGGCGGCAPPDTNGEVGPNHFVQTVNVAFQIWNKAGTSLYGPAAINTLFTGFGGPCQTHNDGDPVVNYDQLADRWVISQFTSSAPYYLCFAVSQTGDPTGAYHRYAFFISNTNFPDYFKVGVWPDAYYVSANVFVGTSSYLGPQAFAMDRVKMLAGQSATVVTAPNLGPEHSFVLPVDLDSLDAIPAGTPGYFIGGVDVVIPIYKFIVDFITPANSSFTNVANLAPAPFARLCPASRDCVPQPGTTRRLASLGDRVMFRAAFRYDINGGKLLLTHAANPSTTGELRGGIRWYEIRGITTNSPSIFQQGTYSPDANNRWMSSGAMDRDGNIAIGYSVASSSLFPSIRYAGRLTTDPLGTLAQGEASLIEGTASQTSINRWGDYSDMTVDPVDDCTFWYTNEFSNGGGSWRTRIGSFKFPSCSSGPIATVTPFGSVTPAPTVTSGPTATPGPCDIYTRTTSTGAVLVPGTTRITGTNQDDNIVRYTSPFSLSFFSQSYSGINVSTNGTVEFVSSDGGFQNTQLPNFFYNNVVAAHWDDLDLTSGGVYYLVSGSAPNRNLDLEWRGNLFGGGPVSFEMRFYENSSRIDLIYATVSGNGSSATIGIQKDFGSVVNQYSFNQSVLSPGLQIRYELPQSCTGATPTPGSGSPTAVGSPTSILPTLTVPMPTVTLPSLTTTPQATGTAAVTATAGPTNTPVPCSTNPTIYGLDSNNRLFSFPATNPISATVVTTITGFNQGETLVGIDFRPASGQLYTYGTGVQGSSMYTINPATAVLSQVGTTMTTTITGTNFGFDFNPTVDRIRLVSDAGANLRLNPDGSLTAIDATLVYTAGDPGFGITPTIVGAAYSNNFAGAGTTTLYDIDSNRDVVVIQSPPNEGKLTTVGSLGVDTNQSVGFDIAPGCPFAYASLTISGTNTSTLYSVNLQSGAASTIGNFPFGVGIVRGIAVGTNQGGGTPTPVAGSPTACVINFTDVPTSNQFYSDIQFLACRGIISGFPNGDGTFRFEPNSNTRRGEFAKIAVRAFGIPPSTPATPTFNDVPSSNIFYQFIEAAAAANVITGLNAQQCAALGTPGTCFGPNLNVSRAQVALIVQRARNYTPVTPATPTFQDVPTNNFAYAAIETLASRGIISGAACPAPQTGQCFRPNDNIRRGELSKVTRRAIESLP